MSPTPDWLFEVPDKDGNLVRLALSRWEMHIRAKHHETTPYIEEIKGLISTPGIITRDAGGCSHLAKLRAVGGKWENLYLEVVVRYKEDPSGSLTGDVLTVYFSGRPPKGEVIWWTIA